MVQHVGRWNETRFRMSRGTTFSEEEGKGREGGGVLSSGSESTRSWAPNITVMRACTGNWGFVSWFS